MTTPGAARTLTLKATGTRAGAVALINPKATYADEIGQKCFPPLGLLYLGASLQRAGFDARVVDANALRLDDEAVVREVAWSRPFLVGVPFCAETLVATARLVRALRRALPDATLVAGGPHASAVPERILAELPEIDHVLVGEAEDSLVALARTVGAGDEPPGPVPGLVSRGQPADRSYQTIRDLDAVPLPARDLVAEVYARRRYYAVLVPHRHIDCLITSRGCPFDCHFCCNPARQMRYRSIDGCLDELQRLRDLGVRNVEILDANFTASEERALTFFARLERERLGISLRIKSRADVVTDRLLRAALAANVYQMSVGAESGSPRILKAMNKRESVDQLLAGAAAIMRHGINCHTSWIIGYPGETDDTIRETFDVVRRMRPTTAGFSILTPYPGTAVYDAARAAGTLVGDWSVAGGPVPWVRLPWTRTHDDLVAARDRVVRRLYLRPHYLWEYGKLVVSTANLTMARYALQELRRVLPGRRRTG
ncbi:MAG: B12-binding domain-containing radical SAM protein [Deltaproteobacteria bacterium]|nr:B12-binding domain-containing radical SAM protein [Deltaproteobacteria bacterium]